MLEQSWDGEWFRRAYYDDGTPLGSAQNDECKIDSLSQSWSVLSGAVPVHLADRSAGAAVDVVSREPIRPDNPLLTARNCTITPHIAWTTREARRRLLNATVANVARFLEGKPTNLIN